MKYEQRQAIYTFMGILVIIMWIALAYGIFVLAIPIWAKVIAVVLLIAWMVGWSM
jgi:hypothetical protein